MGVLKASEAVSGRNILILPIYASVLRPLRGRRADGRECSGFAGYFDFGSGYVIALALFSAKSGGTENAPVLRS